LQLGYRRARTALGKAALALPAKIKAVFSVGCNRKDTLERQSITPELLPNLDKETARLAKVAEAIKNGTPDTTTKRMERQRIALFKEAFRLINEKAGRQRSDLRSCQGG
jgi:hypothetical protein